MQRSSFHLLGLHVHMQPKTKKTVDGHRVVLAHREMQQGPSVQESYVRQINRILRE